ncbi:hypothetical protein [Terribacillus saccharophilus]|uniref:hypothetical protein n=1 Tax=Terribacillus saccharophilus TaxID=361277 RepID=UPI000BA667A0|nr:hypothetical protein [Terribacillus saccharophilus]PAF19719.1 hypothetical protein CHH51_01255 [Terribacillus saccharophilus]
MEVQGIHGDRFIRTYYMNIQNGMNPIDSYCSVTRLVAIYGTARDLQQLIDTHDDYQINRFKEWSEKTNEQSRTAI